jgi:hypothetical protein
VNVIILLLILFSAIFIPLLMLGLVRTVPKFRILLDGFAVLSGYTFGIIAALAVYKILRDDTIFMTNIHGILSNAAFLASGAYLGNYGLYKLIQMLLKHWKPN